MKKIFIAIFCICLVGSAYAGFPDMMKRAGVLGVPAGAPAGGQDFSVDFSEYTAADDHYDGGSGDTWVELACDTGGDADCMTTGAGTTIDTGNDEFDGIENEFVLLYPTQTDTVTQYLSIRFVGSIAAANGVYFRSTNNAAEYAYVLRFDSGSDLQWRDCTGYSCSDIATCDPGFTFEGTDGLGLRVTGTGNDTTLEVWGFDGVTPPTVTAGDVNAAWGAADCTLTTDPNNDADTGKYGGIYNGGNAAESYDDFSFGDSTN